ncbi:alpha/beta fold hydrolase [Gemmata sp.]|uniref:alpha/beta fold hydrolase n=1 Tax=Gemmata sp. TaxID=1914242 RepID=UPI003F6FEFF4
MFTERFIDTGEVRVRVLSGPGDGPPVLFLHGISRCGRDFAPLFPHLAGSWHVHALDHRGHGRSGRVPGGYRVVDYVRDAAAVVRALPEPVVLFGHSLGAVTAAGVAAAEPDRVRGVVLEDPPGSSFLARLDRTMYHPQFAAAQRLAGQNRPVADLARDLANTPLPQPNGGTARLGDFRDAAMIRFAARCLPDVDPGVFDPLLGGSWLDGYDEEAIWRGTPCPVLLLRGEEARGGMLPRPDADRMTAALADCTRVDVPGAGHLIHWLSTEACVRLTLSFLESLRP